MPLLDHFNPPLSRTHPCRAFHGAWAAAMARLLNQGVLPAADYAVPFMDRDGPVEIDIAALTREDVEPSFPRAGAWEPEAALVAVAIDPPAVDSVRVEVLTDDGDPRLAAAVELVSPRNKDRASARRAFAGKCAGYLLRGSGLVGVDVVTTRHGRLNEAIFEAMGGTSSWQETDQSAVAYRTTLSAGRSELQAWPSPLAVGRALPTVPLWLETDLAVPLDLEASYTAAGDDIRVRPAG